MATTGATYTGTASSVAPGSVTWISVTNAQGDTTGTATNANLDSGENSYNLDCTNFSFAIPSGATIDGIEASILARANNQTKATGVWDTVQLIIGGTASGTNLGDSAYIYSSITEHTFGGASNLWGLTPTDTDINASNFGIRIKVREDDDRRDASNCYIYRVALTVTYTESVGGGEPTTSTTSMFMIL